MFLIKKARARESDALVIAPSSKHDMEADASASTTPHGAIPAIRATTIPLAVKAMEHSCCKCSGYRVGVCLITADGKTFSGCNVESDSYGLSVCGERVALFKALSEGATDFVHLACATRDAGTSCGACRQLLAEYCDPSMPVDFVTEDGEIKVATSVAEMLPLPFVLKGKKAP